ncbi:MAG: EFR1 family ferrodoxin [Clostridia bacterium]|nr:EFR1 family ferrodoxin [Clostridia bacterium]
MAENIIYCFSGTGNSLHASIEIAKALTHTHVISMRCRPQDVPSREAEVIGFVFPVYHWTLPEFVRTFIEQVDIHPGAYIFAVATCGGLPVNALNDLAALIRAKHASVAYSAALTTVANYVAAYEPFPRPDRRLPRAEAELSRIQSDIAARKHNRAPAPSPIKEFMRLLETPFAKALPTKDRGFRVSDACVSCGLCARLCIPKNIVMRDNGPAFQHRCAQCMACLVFCPKQAIQYRSQTERRTKYHHPDISAALLSKDALDF